MQSFIKLRKSIACGGSRLCVTVIPFSAILLYMYLYPPQSVSHPGCRWWRRLAVISTGIKFGTDHNPKLPRDIPWFLKPLLLLSLQPSFWIPFDFAVNILSCRIELPIHRVVGKSRQAVYPSSSGCESSQLNHPCMSSHRKDDVDDNAESCGEEAVLSTENDDDAGSIILAVLFRLRFMPGNWFPIIWQQAGSPCSDIIDRLWKQFRTIMASDNWSPSAICAIS